MQSPRLYVCSLRGRFSLDEIIKNKFSSDHPGSSKQFKILKVTCKVTSKRKIFQTFLKLDLEGPILIALEILHWLLVNKHIGERSLQFWSVIFRRKVQIINTLVRKKNCKNQNHSIHYSNFCIASLISLRNFWKHTSSDRSFLGRDLERY